MRYIKILLMGILLSLCSISTSAQISGWGLADTNLPYFPYDISNYEILDTTQLIVKYKAVYPYTDVTKGKEQAEDIMILELGQNINKFYSENMNLMERRKSFKEKVKVRTRQNYLPYMIYENRVGGVREVVNRIPFSSDNEAYSYKENISTINWIIGNQVDTLYGYTCHHAYATINGRIWNVLFTTDIPQPYGPWKLSGLPGLIVKAEDADSIFSFEITEILQIEEPITKPKWHYVLISKKKWMKFEKAIHESPYDYFTQGGTYQIFIGRTNEVMTPEWTIPYFPIEK